MNKLANKMRSVPRTGQAINNNMMGRSTNGGNCAPVAPTRPMSWGAACPTGNCTSENLASSLNRQFAGDRYPCRELPYTLQLTAAGGVVSFEANSKVTICPTRVIVAPEDGELLATA